MTQCPCDEVGTLRVVRIAGISRNQGWAYSTHKPYNTSIDSWTWVDMELSAKDGVAPERAYANRRQAMEFFAYYQEDFDKRSHLVSRWKPGMDIITRLRAEYPAWCMHARWGCVVTFHALPLPIPSPL